MPTEQEAKPAVVTPLLQQWKPIDLPTPGEDPLKWLKEYDRKRSFKTKLKGFWPQCQQNLQSRPTYAAVTRKYRAPVQKFPPEPRKTDVWRTADNRPVCFHCGRPGHVMRYCRERKAVFDNSRNRRRNFDDVGTEEEIRRPNSSRRFTPSPTRGRSPIRRYRSPSPYRRSSQSPGRRSEENRPSKEVRPRVLEILRRPPR
ncbi:CCHC-type domain-containing protein [Trichonephila clavipes]|nr:CCHC-type domain-containing protein [Trichonephila clavipes]